MKGFLIAVASTLFLIQSSSIAAPYECKQGNAYVKVNRKLKKVTVIIKKDIKPQLKSLSIKAKKRRLSSIDLKLQKKLKKQLKKYEGFQKACVTERNEETLAKSPEPISRVQSGNGLEPIPFKMEALRDGLLIPVTCSVVNRSGNVNWVIDGCNGTVTPIDHRSTQAEIQFTATDNSGLASQLTGTISFSFNQSGEFIGNSESLNLYKSSISRLETMRVIKNLAWGFPDSKREELIALAASDNGLEKLANTLLGIGIDAPICSSVEAEAMLRAQGRMDPYTRYENYVLDSLGNPIRDAQNNNSELWPIDRTDVGGKLRNQYAAWSRPIGNYFTAWGTRAAHEYWLHHMRYNCFPFREVMGLWLHNHVGVNLSNFAQWSGRDLDIKSHIDLLRSMKHETQGKRILNFREYIKNIYKDVTATSLDNNVNRYSGGGNENFARELLELATMGPVDPVTGAENYNEENVYSLRRAVMGYTDKRIFTHTLFGSSPVQSNILDFTITNYTPTTLDNRIHPRPRVVGTGVLDLIIARYPIQFVPTNYHPNPDRPDKIFLFAGKPYGSYDIFKADTINAGQDTLTDYLLGLEMKDMQAQQLRQTSRFIAARLLATFGSGHMSENLVGPVAQKLIDTQYDLREAIKMIIMSSSFFAPEASDDCIADPVPSIMYFARSLDLPFVYQTGTVTDGAASGWGVTRDYVNRIFDSNVGQRVTEPGSVFGWQSCGKIIGGRQLNGSSWLGVQSITERRNLIGTFMEDLASQYGVDWFLSMLPNDSTAQRSPDAVLNHFINRMGIELTADQRSALINYLSNAALSNTVANAASGRLAPSNIQAIAWSSLSDADFKSLMRVKIPTLVRLLFMLPQVHTV